MNRGTSPGFVIYYLSSPFPVFSLSVSGIVSLQEAGAAVNVYVTHDDAHWSNAVPLKVAVGNPAQTTVDLTSAVQGQYSYFVMLQLSGRVPNAAQIAAVHITSEVQVAKMLFPTLVPGAINDLTYQDWSPSGDTHDVNISVTVK